MEGTVNRYGLTEKLNPFTANQNEKLTERF